MKRTWRAILALTLVCAVALTAAAMAYQDGKLAVAAYIGNSSMVCVLLLEVYGPEGLLYATARVPSVERQFAADNVRSMWVREDKKAPFPEADISTPTPELTWEK